MKTCPMDMVGIYGESILHGPRESLSPYMYIVSKKCLLPCTLVNMLHVRTYVCTYT